MPSTSKTKYLLYLLILVGLTAGAGAFLAFGPPGLYARSESPEFCGSCHVMSTQYEAWFHSGAHRRLKCVDCHLPNDTALRHLFWKGVDGMRDTVMFHTGMASDKINISSRGAAFVMENCQRCHAETLARVNEDRQCWSCHRRMSHKHAGTILAQTP